ncbi:alanine racemase [Kineobactrum salinum]|uniref:Alanine/ornithine racemase family PLP-dependent enzyme n=1 Tax=Kineobactrum salinum TaxID=2708301 RepID=A0A6C0U7I7_9GAMM|nr:alanine racemase [Kineobactrum salinum]QIB65444.1 alanine/ornithine racemase family PLP-dependent enzyme [Kineobactrum salinum]
MFPELVVSRDRLAGNIRAIKAILDRSNIDAVAVTKGFCAHPLIAEVFTDNGINVLGDSRIQNLKKMRNLPGRRMLLRLPAPSEIDEVVEYADISLVSHYETARALSRCASKRGQTHSVIVMIDMGDMREGVYGASALYDALANIMSLPGIKLEGIGANFCCIGGALPTLEKMNELRRMKEVVEMEQGIFLQTVSGGNSSNLSLLLKQPNSSFYNQLRIGEAFLRGRETVDDQAIAGAHDDCFMIRAEIIERYSKPSAPSGSTGGTGFGKAPAFVNKGLRSRAICALGKLDIDDQQLFPIEEGIKVIGASSDHLVLDVEDCKSAPELGDVLSFKLGYASIMRSMLSPYVQKRIL